MCVCLFSMQVKVEHSRNVQGRDNRYNVRWRMSSTHFGFDIRDHLSLQEDKMRTKLPNQIQLPPKARSTEPA